MIWIIHPLFIYQFLIAPLRHIPYRPRLAPTSCSCVSSLVSFLLSIVSLPVLSRRLAIASRILTPSFPFVPSLYLSSSPTHLIGSYHPHRCRSPLPTYRPITVLRPHLPCGLIHIAPSSPPRCPDGGNELTKTVRILYRRTERLSRRRHRQIGFHNGKQQG